MGEDLVGRHARGEQLEHLSTVSERDRDLVERQPRRAWAETSYEQALEQLQILASELDHSHSGAAASLREGMQETLTVTWTLASSVRAGA